MGLVKVEPGSCTERYLTSSEVGIELVSIKVEEDTDGVKEEPNPVAISIMSENEVSLSVCLTK
jgi:hypothetical protein